FHLPTSTTQVAALATVLHLRSLTRQLLEQIDERFVVTAGCGTQADLACPVASEVRVECPGTDFFGLRHRRGPRKLRMQESPVTGESAASRACRDDRAFGDRGGDRVQLPGEAEMIRRTARMNHR